MFEKKKAAMLAALSEKDWMLTSDLVEQLGPGYGAPFVRRQLKVLGKNGLVQRAKDPNGRGPSAWLLTSKGAWERARGL